ncbi:hypothetical protein TWF481_003057 [Arthrobotrys musiformis]|uniref:Uncharacterized protein n=1 Tax=Arthrobotrys musiformis TaxID=47236 RepID=A0AAV9VRB7_9PEZI
MPDYAIPKVSFQIAKNRDVKGEGGLLWHSVQKSGFIIKSYRHPEISTLCAGTIQNAYRDPGAGIDRGWDPRPVYFANSELGQWVFKSWYIVFKIKKDSKVKEGRRYVAIATMA